MEKGFYHPSRGYWQTTNEPPKSVLDSYPNGTVEVPLKPGPGKVWDGAAWVNDTSPTPTPQSVTRGQFLISAVDTGIITEATAEEAASGAWPTEFNTFLSGLTGQQRIAAKSTWADGGVVRRNNAILALVAENQNLSPKDLDDLFVAASQVQV